MDNNFYNKVLNHHNIVQDRVIKDGGTTLMTVAVGSQNYGLDTAESDCDTFSFILPSFLSFIRGDAPKSYEFEVDDGKCCVKDMRLALNLLRKPSPNSVECFATKYKVYNASYKEIFDTYLQDDKLFFMIHCNYRHMLDAITGTIKGMEGRNMSYGKKAAHTMRLVDMYMQYITGDKYLEMLDEDRLALARKIKGQKDFPREEYEVLRDEAYENLKEITEKFNFDDKTFSRVQQIGENLINNFQLALTDKYLKEYGYVKQHS